MFLFRIKNIKLLFFDWGNTNKNVDETGIHVNPQIYPKFNPDERTNCTPSTEILKYKDFYRLLSGKKS